MRNKYLPLDNKYTLRRLLHALYVLNNNKRKGNMKLMGNKDMTLF